MTGRPYKRRQFLINKQFQLKFTLQLMMAGIIGSAAIATIIYWWWRRNNEFMEMVGMLDPEFNEANTMVIASLVGFVAFLALCLFIWGILLTHRVAGPMYVFSRYLGELAGGKWPNVRPLRKRDEFKDVFNRLNELIASIQDNTQAQNTKLSSIIDRLNNEVALGGGNKVERICNELSDELQNMIDINSEKIGQK